MTGRIFLKLIVAVLAILIVAFTAIDFLVSRLAEQTYVNALRVDLLAKGRLPGTLPREEIRRSFKKYATASDARFTWVATDGRVLADSEVDPDRMENHKSRPELMAALSGHEGWAIRVSRTMGGVSFLFAAVPADGGALRFAVPLSRIST